MSQSTTQATHPVWQIPTIGSAAAISSTAVPSSPAAVALGAGIVVAVIAPWLAHLVPVQGTPLGPTLLPMFYAPLLAALLLRLPLAVAVSAATPIVSRFLTGMPADPILPGMVLQIALFVIAIRALRRHHWLLVVPAAYLGSLVITGMVTATMADVATTSVTGTLQTGWPGVVILAGLGLLAHKSLR